MTTNNHQRPLLLPPLLWPRSLPKPQAFRHIFFSRRLFTLELEQKEKAWVPYISQSFAWQGNCLLLARGPHDRVSFLQGTALWQGTSGRGTKGRAGLNGGTDISVYSCVLFSPHAAPARPMPACCMRHGQGLARIVPQDTTASWEKAPQVQGCFPCLHRAPRRS